MAKRKKRLPRWRRAFLRGLGRSANARLAAREAGIDHGTAYAHAARNPAFDRAWRRALAIGERRADALARAQESVPVGGIAAGRDWRGTELVVRRTRGLPTQLVPAGKGRWSKTAEDLFFAALADCANVRRAAAAAGFSTTAIYKRRMGCPIFQAKWAAAVETGHARIEMGLIEAATRALDVDAIAVPEEAARASVSEALAILKMHHARTESGGKARGGRFTPRPRTLDEVRDSILRKLEALDRHGEDERLEQGWSRDEEGNMIPPGWVRAGP